MTPSSLSGSDPEVVCLDPGIAALLVVDMDQDEAECPPEDAVRLLNMSVIVVILAGEQEYDLDSHGLGCPFGKQHVWSHRPTDPCDSCLRGRWQGLRRHRRAFNRGIAK